MSIKRFIVGGALIAACLPAAASASVKITAVSGSPSYETGKVIYTPGGIGGNAGTTSAQLYIGRNRLTGVDLATNAAVAFDAYCIDIFNWLKTGVFDIQTFTLANATKADQLKTLLGVTDGYIAAAATAAAKQDTAAAIQMAVWEIVNEAGTSGYSLGTGLFRIGTDYGTVVPNARGMAQGYLDALGGWSLPTGKAFRMMTAVNPVSNQRQVFMTTAPVPEPATWAMLIAGFGVVGGALRRTRRSVLRFA